MVPLSCPGLFRDQLLSGVSVGYMLMLSNINLSMCCGNTTLFYTPAAPATCKDVDVALALLPLARDQGLGMTQTPMWLELPFIRIRS